MIVACMLSSGSSLEKVLCVYTVVLMNVQLFYLKEAYEEFKHILLALVYDEDDKNSPVANEVRGYFVGLRFRLPYMFIWQQLDVLLIY